MKVFILSMLTSVCLSCAAVAHAPLIVVTEHAPPLQVVDGDQVTGVVTDKVRTILRDAGVEAEFKVYPWARSYNLANSRPNTLIYPLARTEEREKRFIWLHKVTSLELHFVRLASNTAVKIRSMEDAQKYVIGASRDDMTHEYLLQNGFSDREHMLVESNISTLLERLYMGKIDSFVADLDFLRSLAESQGKDPGQLVSAYPFPYRPEYYLAASLDTDPSIIQALKQP